MLGAVTAVFYALQIDLITRFSLSTGVINYSHLKSWEITTIHFEEAFALFDFGICIPATSIV
jgi:hypothetical protein